MKEIPLKKCDPSSPIMRMSVTKPCFTTRYQTCKTNTKTKSVFLVSDHITDIHTRTHGATENAGVENAGVSQGWKMPKWKMQEATTHGKPLGK